MRVDVKPFDAVFDGTINFVPRAVIDLGRAPELQDLMLNQAVRGEDGLDRFDAVPLVLTADDGRRHRYALWRYKHSPPGQVAIQLPLDDEFQEALAGIMTAMKIPAAAVVWLDRPIAPGSTPARRKKPSSPGRPGRHAS